MEKSPDAFRTISEVADALETPPHVLRFWESRFTQIKPVKRAGGRRYYRPSDVALLSGIKMLLHEEGMTIRGVQKMLREQGIRHVQALADGGSASPGAPARAAPDNVVPLATSDKAETPEPAPQEAAIEPAARAPEAEPAPETEPASATPAAEAPAAQAPVAEAPARPMPAPSTQGEFFFDNATPAATDAPDTEPDTESAPEIAPEIAPLTEPGRAGKPAAADSAAPPAPVPADLADAEPEEEDAGPTLAARIRTLSPAQVGPDGDELATLADRLKALRHKMAGHARRGPR